MPYYLITVILKDGTVSKTVQDHPVTNIDAVFNHFRKQEETAYRGQLKDFDCVMIAKASKTFHQWRASQKKDPFKDVPKLPDFGPHERRRSKK